MIRLDFEKYQNCYPTGDGAGEAISNWLKKYPQLSIGDNYQWHFEGLRFHVLKFDNENYETLFLLEFGDLCSVQ